MQMKSKTIDCVMIVLGWMLHLVLKIILFPPVIIFYSCWRYKEWSDLRDKKRSGGG